MNRLKRLGTALALMGLPLAGCKDEEDDEYDLIVQVRNEGTSPATIAVHFEQSVYGSEEEEGDDFGVVHPGETWTRTYLSASRVYVEIRRSFDNLVLFSDSIRQNHFDEVGGLWLLVVHP